MNPPQSQCDHDGAVFDAHGRAHYCARCEAEEAAHQASSTTTTVTEPIGRRIAIHAIGGAGAIVLGNGLDRAIRGDGPQQPVELALKLEDKFPEFRDHVAVNVQPVQIAFTIPPVTVTSVPPDAKA